MSLQESAVIRRYTNKEGVEVIRDVVLKNVRFNFTYVSRPRPKDDGSEGSTYETNLVITNPATWDVYATAFNEFYEHAVVNTWRNQRPALDKMNLPFYTPKKKDDGTWWDFEEGAIAVIKARSNQAPELFLRVDSPLRAATEDDLDEFYSGMIGDAVISFWAYDKGTGGSPRPGIRMFINGVNKTAVGDPIIFVGNNYDFIGAFSDGSDNASAFSDTPLVGAAPVKPTTTVAGGVAPTTTTPVKPTTTPPPTVVQPAPGLGNLLGGQAQGVKPIQPTEEEAPSNLLQNLINKGLTK